MCAHENHLLKRLNNLLVNTLKNIKKDMKYIYLFNWLEVTCHYELSLWIVIMNFYSLITEKLH